MFKLKKLEEYFGSNHCWRSENNQRLYIHACALGDNFYDYGEEPKDNLDLSDCPENFKDVILNDFRVTIVKCCECGGCAGW